MKHNISLIFLTSLIFFGARGASSEPSFEKVGTGSSRIEPSAGSCVAPSDSRAASLKRRRSCEEFTRMPDESTNTAVPSLQGAGKGWLALIKLDPLTKECFYKDRRIVVQPAQSPFNARPQSYVDSISVGAVHIDPTGNRFSCFGFAQLGKIQDGTFTQSDHLLNRASLLARVDSSDNPISSDIYFLPRSSSMPVGSTPVKISKAYVFRPKLAIRSN